MTPQTLIAIGAVTAALIAGFFSFLNLIISKEQKVSEFRQDWINNLRDEISQYISAITFLAKTHLIKSKNGEAHDLEYANAISQHYDNASRAYTSIILRVNPEDKDLRLRKLNNELLDNIESVRNAVREGQYADALNLSDELPKLARPILKHEWERVKSGERLYKLSRFFAALILVSGLVMSGVSVTYYLNHGEPSTPAANKPIQPAPTSGAADG
jgi:hypothetical protein